MTRARPDHGARAITAICARCKGWTYITLDDPTYSKEIGKELGARIAHLAEIRHITVTDVRDLACCSCVPRQGVLDADRG